MSAASNVETAPGRIAISGEMTIYAATALRDELFPFVLASKEPLQIDLSAVTALDTAGLQLLLMLKRVAQTAGIDAVLANVSLPVQDVLSLCRIDATLRTGAER